MITISKLKKVHESNYFNLTKLCELAGVKYNTILKKFENNSELSVTDSEKFEKAFAKLKEKLN